MPQRRDNAGAVCNSGMGMLFLCIYVFYIISLRGMMNFFFMHNTWCMMHDAWFTMHDARYRVSQKKGDLFYDHYLHQIKYKFTGYLFNLKGGIHSSIWSTKAILYHIREPRYKQRNIGYKISKIWKNEQSNSFKSDSA